MQPNPGRLPPECVVWGEDGNVASYRPVMVKLWGGIRSGPWPSAGGRPPTDWSISRPPHPFQIEEFEVT